MIGCACKALSSYLGFETCCGFPNIRETNIREGNFNVFWFGLVWFDLVWFGGLFVMGDW